MMSGLWGVLDAVENTQIDRIQELIVGNVFSLQRRRETFQEGMYLALTNRKSDAISFYVDRHETPIPHDVRQSMLRSIMHNVTDTQLFRILVRSRVPMDNDIHTRPITMWDILLPTIGLSHDLIYVHILEEAFGREEWLVAKANLEASVMRPPNITEEFNKHVYDGNITKIVDMIEKKKRMVTFEDLLFVTRGGHVAVLRPVLRAYIDTLVQYPIHEWKDIVIQMMDNEMPAAAFFLFLKYMKLSQINVVHTFSEDFVTHAMNVPRSFYLDLLIGAGATVTLDHVRRFLQMHRNPYPYIEHLDVLMRSGLQVTPEILDFAHQISGAGLFILPYIGDGSEEAQDAFLGSEDFWSYLLVSPTGLNLLQFMYHSDIVSMQLLIRLWNFITDFGDQITNEARRILAFIEIEDEQYLATMQTDSSSSQSPLGTYDDDDDENDEDMPVNFWEPVEQNPITQNETMQLYLHFFETFCESAEYVDDMKLDRFRQTLLACSDILELTVADRTVLEKRNDRQALCEWMTRKQKERLRNISEDTNDPITYATCPEIPLLFLVVLHNQCFEISSLWMYLQADPRHLNPSTRQKFTDDEIEMINRRYEATLQVLNGLREMVRDI